jgi:6-phosphogluconolactonase (cycloisomerase 2 family)
VLPDKSGDYVYVANASDGTISGYTFDSTAQTLAALSATTPSSASPIALAEDSSKSYIVSIGNGANPDLWLYSFDSAANGTLDITTSTSTLSTSPADANALVVTF